MRKVVPVWCRLPAGRHSALFLPNRLKDSEPGCGFVLPVLLAESRFEDPALGARPEDLHGNQNQEKQE